MAARPATPPSRKPAKTPKATAPHDSQPRARPRVGASLTSPRPMPRGEIRASSRKKAPTARAASSPRASRPRSPTADAGQQQQAEHDREGRVGDPVGQQAGAGVDHGQDHAEERQGQVGGDGPAEPGRGQPQGDQEPQQPHAQLDQRVADGDGRPAVPAAASQQQPAEHGQVVPPGHRLAAGRAARGRPDDRLAPWHPVDDHVGERAEGQSQQPGQGGDGEWVHGLRSVPLPAPEGRQRSTGGGPARRSSGPGSPRPRSRSARRRWCPGSRTSRRRCRW